MHLSFKQSLQQKNGGRLMNNDIRESINMEAAELQDELTRDALFDGGARKHPSEHNRK